MGIGERRQNVESKKKRTTKTGVVTEQNQTRRDKKQTRALCLCLRTPAKTVLAAVPLDGDLDVRRDDNAARLVAVVGEDLLGRFRSSEGMAVAVLAALAGRRVGRRDALARQTGLLLLDVGRAALQGKRVAADARVAAVAAACAVAAAGAIAAALGAAGRGEAQGFVDVRDFCQEVADVGDAGADNERADFGRGPVGRVDEFEGRVGAGVVEVCAANNGNDTGAGLC